MLANALNNRVFVTGLRHNNKALKVSQTSEKSGLFLVFVPFYTDP